MSESVEHTLDRESQFKADEAVLPASRSVG